MGSSVSDPSSPAPVAEFAAKLRELRIECGEPSYTAISQVRSPNGESISTGSISALLNGEHLPKIKMVRAFVRGVLHYRDGGAQPEHAEIIQGWSDQWTKVRQALASLETSEVDHVKTPATALPPTPSDDARVPDSFTLRRPPRGDLMSPQVRTFQALVTEALEARDTEGRRWGDAKYGCYAFYDYDGEPIFVGQTSERLRIRVKRHLINQRTDAVAMRVLDVAEVAEVELWPLWHLQDTPSTNFLKNTSLRRELNSVEYTVYVQAVSQSNFGILLNEQIPAAERMVELPPSGRFQLADTSLRYERGNTQVRIARRAETLARLANTVLDRGHVSDGLRRALVVQAARLVQLAASHLAHATGSPDIGVHVHGLDTLTRPPADDLADLEGMEDSG